LNKTQTLSIGQSCDSVKQPQTIIQKTKDQWVFSKNKRFSQVK